MNTSCISSHIIISLLLPASTVMATSCISNHIIIFLLLPASAVMATSYISNHMIIFLLLPVSAIISSFPYYFLHQLSWHNFLITSCISNHIISLLLPAPVVMTSFHYYFLHQQSYHHFLITSWISSHHFTSLSLPASAVITSIRYHFLHKQSQLPLPYHFLHQQSSLHVLITSCIGSHNITSCFSSQLQSWHHIKQQIPFEVNKKHYKSNDHNVTGIVNHNYSQLQLIKKTIKLTSNWVSCWWRLPLIAINCEMEIGRMLFLSRRNRGGGLITISSLAVGDAASGDNSEVIKKQENI